MSSRFLKAAITVAMLTLGSSVFAGGLTDFSGNWVGKGTYILDGDMTQCSVMQLEFSATANEFTFVSGRRVCDKHNEVFARVSMQYRNGEVFMGSQKVGSYDANKMQTAFRAPDGNSFRNWHMTMTREGQHLVYEESRTMDGETTPKISFAGLLILQK